MGREDEAMSEAELGLELDPLNSFSQCFYVGQMLHMHQYDEAVLRLRKILSLEPNFPFAHRYLWICYHQKQLYDEAIEESKNFFSAMGKSELSDIIVRGYSDSDYEDATDTPMNDEKRINYILTNCIKVFDVKVIKIPET